MILIKAIGNCPKCNMEYKEPFDTTQSIELECSKCGKKYTMCFKCKNKGCECGGNLIDFWDKNPNKMI